MPYHRGGSDTRPVWFLDPSQCPGSRSSRGAWHGGCGFWESGCAAVSAQASAPGGREGQGHRHASEAWGYSAVCRPRVLKAELDLFGNIIIALCEARCSELLIPSYPSSPLLFSSPEYLKLSLLFMCVLFKQVLFSVQIFLICIDDTVL